MKVEEGRLEMMGVFGVQDDRFLRRLLLVGKDY